MNKLDPTFLLSVLSDVDKILEHVERHKVPGENPEIHTTFDKLADVHCHIIRILNKKEWKVGE